MEPKLNELSQVSQYAPGIEKDGWWKFNVRAKKKTGQNGDELLLESSFCLQSLPSSIGISLEAIEGDEPQLTVTNQPAISSASTVGEHVPSPTIEVPQNYDDESTPSTTNHANQTTAPPDPASPVSQNENAEATSQIALEQSAESHGYTFTVTGVQRGVGDVPSVNESSQINYQLTGETARNLILDSSTSLRFYQESRDVFKFENKVLHVVLPNELYEDVKEFRDKYDDLLSRIKAIARKSNIPLSDLQARVCNGVRSNLKRKRVRRTKSTQQVLELLERFGNNILNTEALDILIEAFKGYDKVEELSAEKKAFSSRVHEFSKTLSMRLLHNCEIDWSQARSVRCIVDDKEAVKGIMIDVCVLLNESFCLNAGIEATMDIPGLVKDCMGVIFSLHATDAIGVGIVSYNLLEAVAPPTVAHDDFGGGGGGEREERGGNEQGNIYNKTADQKQDHQRQDPPRPPQDSTAQPSAKDSHSKTDDAKPPFVPPPPPPHFNYQNFTTENETAAQEPAGVKVSGNSQFYNNTTKSGPEPTTENSNPTAEIVYAGSQTYARSRNSSNPQHNHTMPRRVLPKQPKVKKSFQYSQNKEYELIVQVIAIFLTTVLILFTVISTYCLFLSVLRFGAFLFWNRDDEYQQCFFHKKFMEWPSQLLHSLFFFVKKILRLLMWICVILLVYFVLHTINQLSTSTWEKVFMLGLAVFALILIIYALKDNIDFKLDQKLQNLLEIIKPVLRSIFPLAVILGCAYLLQILLMYDVIDLRIVGVAVIAIIILIFILKPMLKSLYQIIANLSIPTYFHTIRNGIIILLMLVLWWIIGDQVFFIVGLVIAIVILPPILLFVGRVIKQVWESNLMLFVVTQLVGFAVLFFFIPLSNSGELYSWYIVTIVSFILGCNTTIIFFKAIGNLIAFIALMFSQLLYLPGLQTKQFNDFGAHLISIK